MSRLPAHIAVAVFDPATPFEKILATNAGLDTWHSNILISKELREKLRNVPNIGTAELALSGGMHMETQKLILGVQIGPLRIESVEALVVDGGGHDLLLGRDIFDQLFDVGSNEEHASIFSAAKEDNDALSIELYPIKMPLPLRHLDNFLKGQRKLYNVLVVASGLVKLDGLRTENVDEFINNDVGMPNKYALQLSAIDDGSIWISLKSGSAAILKQVASMFQRGASAKLSQEISEAQKSETAAEISKETREAVVQQMLAEKEMLKAENIHKTYEAYRKECLARLQFFDNLISQVADPRIAEELRRYKDSAIKEMAEQEMVPIVRNVPGSHKIVVPPQKRLQLPPYA